MNKSKRSIRPAGVAFQPRGPAPVVNAIPTSYMSTSVDPTWVRATGKVTHPELGGGVRIVGRQLLAQITTTAGDNQLFSVANSPAAVTVNQLEVSPDSFGGRLALQARVYDRYAFRKLVFTYVNRVPTSQAGSFAIGYVSDTSNGGATSFAAVTSMSPAMQSSFITPMARMTAIDDMTSQKTWYTALDATSLASKRLCVQGSLLGFPDVTSIGAVTMGYLWADYMIDLYQPTADEGFSLRLSRAERDLVLSSRNTSHEDLSRDTLLDRIERLEQILREEEEEEALLREQQRNIPPKEPLRSRI